MKNNSRTVPWAADEYIYAMGFRLVYTLTRTGALTIHLPGRTSTTIDALREKGIPVRLPRRGRVLGSV